MQRDTKLYIGLQLVLGFTKGYIGYRVLQKVQGLQRVSRGYKQLKRVRKGYDGLQRVTRGYIGIQRG